MMKREGVIRRKMWRLRILGVLGLFVSVVIQVTGQDLPQDIAGDSLDIPAVDPGIQILSLIHISEPTRPY